MGKSGSGILDGKNVSKIPKMKSITLAGSNNISEKEELLLTLPPSSQPKLQFQTFFNLTSPANSAFQCISHKLYLLFDMYIRIVEI